MKVSEMRIGNLVGIKSRPVAKVYAIEEDYIDLDYQDFGWKPEQRKIEDIAPIPLTEEWLIRFGFISGRLKFGQWYLKFSGAQFWLNDIGIEIFYVHQLQNLYHALTGDELTIKA